MTRPKTTALTDRQRQVFDEIVAFHAKCGYMPTLRELGERFQIRTNAVNDHLRALERKGWLQRDEVSSRAMRLTPQVDTSPSGLLARATSLANSWPGKSDLYVGEDEAWWAVVLRASGDQTLCERVRATLEPDFVRLCWRSSNSDGVHVYTWGNLPHERSEHLSALSVVVDESLLQEATGT